MICKRCGSTNADTDRFCRRCGTKLSEDVSEGGSSTEKAVPVSKKTVRIDKSEFVSRQSGFRVHDCGYPLLPEMTVCPNCKLPVGGAVPPEEQPPAPKPAEPVSKKTEVISLKSSKATR